MMMNRNSDEIMMDDFNRNYTDLSPSVPVATADYDVFSDSLCPPILTPIPQSSDVDRNNYGLTGMPGLYPIPYPESEQDLSARRGSNPSGKMNRLLQQKAQTSCEQQSKDGLKQRRLQNGIPFTIIRLPPATTHSSVTATSLSGRVLTPKSRVPSVKLRMIRPLLPSLAPSTNPVNSAALYRSQPGPPPAVTILDSGKMTLDDYLAVPNGTNESSMSGGDTNDASPPNNSAAEVIESVISEPPPDEIFDEIVGPLFSRGFADSISTKKAKKKRKKKLMRNQMKNLHEVCSESILMAEDCRLRREGKDDSPCWQTVINDKLITDISIPSSDDVLQWSVEEVSDFVSNFPHSTSAIAEQFRENLIDGEALLLLTQDDFLDRLNIKLGLAVKLYHSVLSVKHAKSRQALL